MIYKFLISISLLLFPSFIRAQSNFPVDISKVANRAFLDDKAGNGGGGWSDEGLGNSLRGFTPGKRHFAGLEFKILNPENNNGNACIVFGLGKQNLAESIV